MSLLERRQDVVLKTRPLEYLGIESCCPICDRKTYAAIVETTARVKPCLSKPIEEVKRITVLRYCPGCPDPTNISRLTADERRVVAAGIGKAKIALRKLRQHAEWRRKAVDAQMKP